MEAVLDSASDTNVKILAANTWIIARRDHVDEKTQGGIFLPAATRQAQERETGCGVVESVGDGTNPHNGGSGTPPCVPGDRIIWSTYAERVVLSQEEGDLVAIPFKEMIGVLADGGDEQC